MICKQKSPLDRLAFSSAQCTEYVESLRVWCYASFANGVELPVEDGIVMKIAEKSLRFGKPPFFGDERSFLMQNDRKLRLIAKSETISANESYWENQFVKKPFTKITASTQSWRDWEVTKPQLLACLWAERYSHIGHPKVLWFSWTDRRWRSTFRLCDISLWQISHWNFLWKCSKWCFISGME